MIKIAMLGMGRMGKEIIRASVSTQEPASTQEFRIVAAVDAPDGSCIGKDAGTIAGIGSLGVAVTGSDMLSETLDNARPDVVIDFTSADACVKNSRIVCNSGINLVIGTTGLNESQTGELKENINRGNIGAVISPNMSIGVNVFWKLIREATGLLDGKDYDIEIIEMHHRFKKDAPSGTALRAADVISEELGKNLNDLAVYGRKGISERSKKEIGIHAVRAGDIVGEHTVLFGNLGERIEITHRAHSRLAFANGALEAVKFVHRKKGIYDMGDVLGLK